ncbi:hypothetical protein Taro_050880 [Colocasia esculenta]|uniref:C2H2-type domain-containing protein n=1 Tax=Colocasia esculenta TaxID=4460 RepID=A0A843XEI7_COLES|nr:hypothetical protein [Colocasia esculenta]
MWTRRKLGGGPHLPGLTGAAASVASYDDSWEEQAFAEDSAGSLGGCVWPPRSYSCSFCRREFRSAQALGGHMNVHRRDRARLKLSPVAHIEGSHHPHQQQLLHNPNPCSPMSSRYPPQVCALVYSNNSPNPCAISGFVPSRSRLSPSRVSVAASPQDNPSEHAILPPSFSATSIQENRRPCLFSNPPSLSDRLSLCILTVPELKLGNGDLKFKKVDCRDKRCGQEVEETPSNKRRRLDVTTINPLLNLGSAKGDGSALQTGVDGLSPSSSMGELDLELRLGDPPKIK